MGNERRFLGGEAPQTPPGGKAQDTISKNLPFRGKFFEMIFKKRRLRKKKSKNICRNIFFEKYGRSDPAVGLPTARITKIFKRPENREDGSDFDDFWTV